MGVSRCLAGSSLGKTALIQELRIGMPTILLQSVGKSTMYGTVRAEDPDIGPSDREHTLRPGSPVTFIQRTPWPGGLHPHLGPELYCVASQCPESKDMAFKCLLIGLECKPIHSSSAFRGTCIFPFHVSVGASDQSLQMK